MVPENCEIVTDSRSSVPMSGELDVFRLRNNFQTAKIYTLLNSLPLDASTYRVAENEWIKDCNAYS